MVELLFPSGWQPFLTGGLLIGVGVSLMFICFGRVVGMSSFFSSTWSWASGLAYFQQPSLRGTRTWRLWCAVGLILGVMAWQFVQGSGVALTTDVSPERLLIGGLFVGFGARMSNGCTSGHGICGLSSLSGPSALAVLIFMGVAMLTANAMVWLTGVRP
jgi:uncharacterized membrane protein YedE/YeeE